LPSLRRSVNLVFAFLVGLVALSPAVAEEGHHEFHRNEIGFVIAGLSSFNDAVGDDSIVFGLEYERRFTKAVSAIGMVEAGTGDHKRTELVGLMFGYRFGSLRLAGGPGVEWSEHESEHSETEKKTNEVVVTRASYALPLGAIEVAPTVGFDFVGETENNIVYGVTLVFGF
jgi:hypothetical protein